MILKYEVGRIRGKLFIVHLLCDLSSLDVLMYRGYPWLNSLINCMTILMKKSCILCLSILIIWFSCSTPADSKVLSNETWTISIGNEQSWTGRNNTGNLSYYGCDQNCDCIYLTGGKITCRDGVCNTTWQNKKNSYVVSSPITKAIARGQTSSTLTIFSDSQVVLKEELYPKPFDNIDYQN